MAWAGSSWNPRLTVAGGGPKQTHGARPGRGRPMHGRSWPVECSAHGPWSSAAGSVGDGVGWARGGHDGAAPLARGLAPRRRRHWRRCGARAGSTLPNQLLMIRNSSASLTRTEHRSMADLRSESKSAAASRASGPARDQSCGCEVETNLPPLFKKRNHSKKTA